MPPKSKAKAKAKSGSTKEFIKKVSKVKAVDDSGTVFKGFYVWSDKAPSVKEDPDSLFAKCLVQPGSTNETLKLKQIEPPGDDVDFIVPQSNVFNYNANLDALAIADIGLLPHTNIPSVLDFLRQRYVTAQIYTTADPLLVAINPFKNIGTATDEYIIQYRDVPDLGTLPPHNFAIARTALENLHAVGKNQTIIVSGESGAGKTEATKMMMRFFAAAKSGSLNPRIQNAVMAANPVLEAFGNAKTIRNNNSSRFGRFMQLQVAKGGGIEFGSVRNFLLEKSRLIAQDSNDRSYHVFYFLLKGCSAEQKKKYHLLNLNDYKMLNPSCTEAPGIDDVEEYAEMDKSFDSMLLTQEQKESIYSIVSGVLLMGNVDIIAVSKGGVPDAAEISAKSRETFEKACELLFLEPKAVEEALTVKISIAGGQEVRGMWRESEALVLRGSLSKGVYDKLFDWIVKKLNTNIEPPEGFTKFLGMLDIFGFEVFKNNSLEQMFINITNEMLQKNFTDVVFEREQALYKKEGVSCADLVYTSNAPVICMLTDKKNSLMAVLEDQCLAPGGTDEKLLGAAYKMLADNDKFIKPKVASNINFVVAHTIGDIQYCITGFLFKNKDVLRPDLVEVLQRSTNSVTAALFEGVSTEKGKGSKGQLIGSQFMNQLDRLMGIINGTEPHFVRCVKPNETKRPLEWNAAKVLIQLHSLSILEALQLRENGYSYRRPFEDFLKQFRFVDIGLADDTSKPAKERAQRMLERAGIKKGLAVGETMVFLKSEASKEIANVQRKCMAAWVPVVQLLEGFWTKYKLKKAYQVQRPVLSRVQALARKKLVHIVQPPRFTDNIQQWA